MNEAGKLRGEGFRCCGALWYDPPSLPARRPWVQQVDDATHGVKGLDAACCEHRPPQPTVAGEASRPHHFWPAWPRWWCWQATRARNRKEAFRGSVTTLPRTISRAVAWPCDAQANFLKNKFPQLTCENGNNSNPLSVESCVTGNNKGSGFSDDESCGGTASISTAVGAARAAALSGACSREASMLEWHDLMRSPLVVSALARVCARPDVVGPAEAARSCACPYVRTYGTPRARTRTAYV
jgi:hypothetical protein